MIKEYVAVLWNSKERVSEDVYVEVKDDVKLQNILAEAERKALAYAKEKFGWPEEEAICISLNSVSLNLPEGRKIIGTCKECKWWERHIEEYENLNYGKCSCLKFAYKFSDYSPRNQESDIKDMLVYGDDEGYHADFETGEDFGCIHWERKE